MINPVLKKELKTRMRTWRTSAIISIYILLLGGLMFITFFENFYSGSYYNGFRPSNLSSMYIIFIIFQLMLILFIVPATTSSSISGERERQTLDLLIGTRLSSFSIVVGKLMASLAQILLLIIVSIPVLSILFLFGGFSISNLILLFIFYIITAIFYGSIGVFLSSFFRRTTTSTIVSYVLTMFLTLGTLITVVIWRGLQYARVYRIGGVQLTSFYPFIMYLNPLSGLSDILENQIGINIFEGLVFHGPKAPELLSFYINVGLSIVLSVILLYLASVRINPMKGFGNGSNTRRKKKKSNKKAKTTRK